MVLIKNCDNMFWGVAIDAGKRYSQVVKQGFHVSMAALEVHAKKPSENVQVMLQHESSEYLLCTLNSNLVQQPLDLNFATGEQVSFSLNGSGVVHLTGYIIPEDDEDFDEESFSESEEEEIPSLVDASGDGKNKLAGKRKAIGSSQTPKRRKLADNVEGVESDDDEKDSDEDSDGDSEEEEGFSDDFGDADFDDEDDEDDLDFIPEKKGNNKETPVSLKKKQNVKSPVQDVASAKPANKTTKQDEKASKSPKQIATPKQETKTPKQELGTPKQGDKAQPAGTPSTPASEESAKKKKKKKKNKKEGDASLNESSASSPGTTPKTESTPKKRVVAGGTVVEDLKVGHGPEAKPGKMASVYYVGTLAKSSKRFDSCTDGKPFRFRLNQGEVIKGWDNGVLGMKVGGKRRITVPANQGYGNVKQGPIPPNSTLVFEVELKAVS